VKSEERRFPNCRFEAETVKKAIQTFDHELKGENAIRVSPLIATIDDTERGHDDEAEFFADYRKDPDNVTYKRKVVGQDSSVIAEMRFHTYRSGSRPPSVTVEVQASKWPEILAVMEVFESEKVRATLPIPKEEPPVIFLGHGQSESWKQLRDHLQDKHGFKIEAYEIGARSGHAIRDILQSMLASRPLPFL
jgi:hypothetical protein